MQFPLSVFHMSCTLLCAQPLLEKASHIHASILSKYYYWLIESILIYLTGSYVLFHTDLSGQWLWNLQGLYSSVLEMNDEVPHKLGDQGGLECHVLFVSISLD